MQYTCGPVKAVLFCFLFLGLFGSEPVSARDLTADEILNRVDDLYRGESSHGRMTMIIQTEHWERTLTLEFWNKGKDRALIRVLAPLKEKGTATLRYGNEIWNYLPKVNRVIKLPSSMMSASWMGSHFTNDDLVKESRMTEDYTFEITFQGEREGRDVIEIRCLPKPDAPVVWGKVLVLVRREHYVPLKLDYFDEDMELARTMSFDDVQRIEDRVIPTKVTMLPEDKPGERTVVLYEEINFNVDIADGFFSLRNLKR